MRDTHTRASGRAEGRIEEGRENHEKLALAWIPREGKGGGDGGKYIDDISAKHVDEEGGGRKRRWRRRRSLWRRQTTKRHRLSRLSRGAVERDTGDWRQLKRAVTLRARKWFSLRLARRLIEVHKNPFFIRDRGDFQCHVM